MNDIRSKRCGLSYQPIDLFVHEGKRRLIALGKYVLPFKF